MTYSDRRLMKRVAIICVLLLAFLLPATAPARGWRLGQWDPGVHNVKNAIYWAFCGHKYRYCWLGNEAWAVAGCETGYTYTTWSENGQYKGLFQMGSGERARWGFGNDPWEQATSAYRMYVWTSTNERGDRWHRWSCKP